MRPLLLAIAHLKGVTLNHTITLVFAATPDSFFMMALKTVDKEDLLVIVGNWIPRNGPVGMESRHILGKFALGPRCSIGRPLCGLGVIASYMHMGSVIKRAEVNWSFLQLKQLEISHSSTQHFLEVLKT